MMGLKSLLWIILFFVYLLVHQIYGESPAFHQELRCNSSDLNPRWMSSLPDSRPLQLLSIPGTHDSLALYGGEQWQCQTMSLRDQLQAGIRALDIRCRHVFDRFLIYHAFMSQRADLDNVLQAIQTFLEENPSEVVLMRVKEEWLSDKNTQSFEQTFKRVYLEKYRKLIWNPETKDLSQITLGQVRGKVVILQDFYSDHPHHDDDHKKPAIYGPKFSGAVTQDDFMLMTIWSLYSKWLKVKDHLYAANSSLALLQPHHPFYINFLSGSLGVKPYFVASGHSQWGTDSPRQYFGLINMVTSPNKYEDFPRERCLLGGRYCLVYFDGTNMLTHSRLITERFNYVGIVFADFPGCGLIRAIIDVNGNL